MKWLFSTTIATLLASSATSSDEYPDTEVESPDTEVWTDLIFSLRGDDNRLFRNDATEHTAERQLAGDCDKLSDAAQLLTSSFTDEHSMFLKGLAAEYSVLCILDNPDNRAAFADAAPDIHKAVVALAESDIAWVSALACNLIFIATFANGQNHQLFFHEGAVETLGKIIMDSESFAVQAMYAAAALSNLAASYCETEGNDGTCAWAWSEDNEDIQLAPETSMISDGTDVRVRVLEVEGLVDALTELACREPIRAAEEGSDEVVVMPGSTAVDGEHDNHPAVVTWAAMTLLKNLALEPSAKPYLEEKGVLECACSLKDSADWLEESKSRDLIYLMRRTENPCWENEDMSACVDGNFIDESNYTCDDLLELEEGDCELYFDKFTGRNAAEMCCQCGKGPVPDEESEEVSYPVPDEEYEEVF